MVLRDDKLIYDVGMHLGEDTDFYLRKGFNVVGFEANPDLVRQCKLRFQDAIDAGRLRIVEGAIAPEEVGDSVTFFVNMLSVWGTVNPSWVDRNVSLGAESKEITVQTIKFREILRETGIPHFMKIDIEGCDHFVLKCLMDFESKPMHISIESEKVDFSALELEIKSLVQLGYSKFRAVQQEDIPGSTRSLTTLDGEVFEYKFDNHASGAFGEDVKQDWRTSIEVLREYRKIFQRYRAFGDHSILNKSPKIVQKPARIAYKLLNGYGGPLPGWFDTHASL